VCGILHEDPKEQEKTGDYGQQIYKMVIQAPHLSAELKKIGDGWHSTTLLHTEVSEWPLSELRDEQRYTGMDHHLV
jgi:hypothetical protein